VGEGRGYGVWAGYWGTGMEEKCLIVVEVGAEVGVSWEDFEEYWDVAYAVFTLH